MKEPSLCSLVVLSWNTLEETKACLGSLNRLSYTNYEIIVVDNGSNDGSKEYLKSLGKKIKYVDLPKNTGFTGGQIEALKHCRGEYIALINSDAVVDASWLSVLVKDLSNDNSLAAVGGKSYNYNDENDPYDTNNSYYSYQVVDPVRGYGETLQKGKEKAYVNSVSGAGVVIRKSVIDEIGYFDDSFFAYYEETDLFARFIRAGYQIGYNPDAHIWHKIAASSKGSSSDFYLTQMEQNRYRFAYKNFDFKFLPSLMLDYWSKYLRAVIKKLVKRSDSLHDARFKAGTSNLKRGGKLWVDRIRTQRLGGSYSKQLFKHANEKVTVVIPCYNYENYVGQAIESVLKQTVKPARVIIINDGSKDNSLKEINKYKGSVEVIDQKNKGIVKTKNIGLNLVDTEWVLFLDADDLLPEGYIESILKTSRLKTADVIYTDMEFFGARQMHFKAKKFSGYRLRIGNFIHNSALIRSTSLKDIGGYKNEMAAGYEDWEMYVTLFESKAKFEYDKNCPPLLYRQHEVSSRNAGAQEKEAKLRQTINQLHPGFLFQGFSVAYLNDPKELLRYFKHRVSIFPFRPSDIKFRIVRILVKLDTFLEFRILPHARILGKPVGFIRMLLRGEIKDIMKKISK